MWNAGTLQLSTAHSQGERKKKACRDGARTQKRHPLSRAHSHPCQAGPGQSHVCARMEMTNSRTEMALLVEGVYPEVTIRQDVLRNVDGVVEVRDRYSVGLPHPVTLPILACAGVPCHPAMACLLVVPPNDNACARPGHKAG